MRKEIIEGANIYAPCDAAATVRYVGKTVQSIDQRLAQHRCSAARKSPPVGRWLANTPMQQCSF